MFYSHEVLTSREHGVATIWLVATLGSKSTTRKINRKAIQDVDVPKACGMIIHPEAPMALRLQGNLLYGVSKVYNQQCGYILMDAQAVRDRMTTMLKVLHGGTLDPDAGKARPDQIIMPEDPAFVPSLMLPGLNLDLSVLDITTVLENPRKSSFLPSYFSRSNKSNPSNEEDPQLNLSSSQIGPGAFGNFGLPSEVSTVKKGPQVELPAYLGEEEGVLLQPDFEFDAEGNIIELNACDQLDPMVIDETGGENRNFEMTGARREVSEGIKDRFEGIPMEPDIAEMDVDIAVHDSPLAGRQRLEIDSPAGHTAEQQESAPLKKRRVKNNIGADERPELRNSDLAQWNSEYAQNMETAAKMKDSNKLVTIAKKNAAFCVLGIGIAAVGLGLGASHVPHPLDMFSGSRLFSALTGISRGRGRKRSHCEVDESDLEEWAGKARYQEDGFDRGVGLEHQGVLPSDDVEIGRNRPPSLQDDASSHMPWNITASVHSSHRGSSVGRSGISSALRAGQEPFASNSGIRRRGRLTSASPLAGRGSRRDGSLGLSLPYDNLDLDMLGGIDAESAAGDYAGGQRLGMGSPAIVREKTENPEWFLSNFDEQNVNFLEFVKMHVNKVAVDARKGREIAFSSLLPTKTTSRVVATQALLNTLTLATNGLLRVRQAVDILSARGCEDAGNILLSLTSETRAT